MAHFDLHQQEQISDLKYYWNKGGKYVLGLLVILIAVYFANMFWSWHNSTQASNAAVIYADFNNAITSDDKKKILADTYELQNQYPKTEYSAMASLIAAKAVLQDKDSATSAKLLNWIIDNAKDQGLVSIARLRLADIYIDEQKFDKAMHQMTQKHDPAFDVLYYTKRGDLYIAKGDLNKARDAYKEALQRAGNDNNMTQVIQLRLDMLGNS